MTSSVDSRALAAQCLIPVLHEGAAFHPRVVRQQFPTLDKRTIAFIIHLCFGVLRYYFYLQQCLDQYLKKPLKARDKDVRCLLLIGLYQILFSDSPPYAIINSTVEGVLYFDKPWAKALINGILRQAQRDKPRLLEEDIAQQCHPRWLRRAIEQAWPQEAARLFQANMLAPPMILRINTQKTTMTDYLAYLSKQGIAARACAFSPDAILLNEAWDIEQLPYFAQGWLSVQDAGAQWAASLLPLVPGQRILDACAAPGGKMAHLLEKEPFLDMLALEKSPLRFPRLQDTLTRLQLNATIQCADATQPSSWWDQKPFDCIIIDAPCSATGVLRRHPDSKLHRQERDIPVLVKTQLSLLEALWPLLKPHGTLLYITCSLLPAENVEVMQTFIQRHPDAQEWPFVQEYGIQQAIGWQILPLTIDSDGFYYARLHKIPQ